MDTFLGVLWIVLTLVIGTSIYASLNKHLSIMHFGIGGFLGFLGSIYGGSAFLVMYIFSLLGLV